MIVPFENDSVMSKVRGGGGGNVTVFIENLYGTDDLPQKVASAIDKAMYKLRQSGNSRVFA
jgi:hypothetical protein